MGNVVMPRRNGKGADCGYAVGDCSSGNAVFETAFMAKEVSIYLRYGNDELYLVCDAFYRFVSVMPGLQQLGFNVRDYSSGSRFLFPVTVESKKVTVDLQNSQYGHPSLGYMFYR